MRFLWDDATMPPMNFNEYRRYDLVGLSELIVKKEVSPNEIISLAEEAYYQLNPKLNAVVHPMFDEAKKVIETIDPNSRFRGLPILIKDLRIAYKGQPTSFSSSFFDSYVADHDSEIVKRYRKAGLVICGKTNVPEFGLLGVTESKRNGVCRNPWNLNYTPGGSSGGSAASVAAGIVPIAQADDGGGSIRIPASACGLVGLKPTRARVPLGPERAEGWSGLVSSLAVCKSVRDTAFLLDEVHGPELGSPYFSPHQPQSFASSIQKPTSNLKVAVSTDSILGRNTDFQCQRAVEGVAKELENLGHKIEWCSPKVPKREIRLAYFIIVSANVATEINHWAKIFNKKPKARYFDESTWFLYLLGNALSAVEYKKAIKTARDTTKILGKFYQNYDLWLTPTLAYPPSQVEELSLKPIEIMGIRFLGTFPLKTIMLKTLEQLADSAFEKTPNTQLFNLSGTPGISLPTHVGANNLPIGVQIGAAMGREDLLLNIAQQLEEKYQWNLRNFPDL